MIKINEYADKFMKLPRPDRRVIEKIIHEIYSKGREDERIRIFKITYAKKDYPIK